VVQVAVALVGLCRAHEEQQARRNVQQSRTPPESLPIDRVGLPAGAKALPEGT